MSKDLSKQRQRLANVSTIVIESFLYSQQVATKKKKCIVVKYTLQEIATKCFVVSCPPGVRAGCILLSFSQAEDGCVLLGSSQALRQDCWAAAQA